MGDKLALNTQSHLVVIPEKKKKVERVKALLYSSEGGGEEIMGCRYQALY